MDKNEYNTYLELHNKVSEHVKSIYPQANIEILSVMPYAYPDDPDKQDKQYVQIKYEWIETPRSISTMILPLDIFLGGKEDYDRLPKLTGLVC